MEKVLECFLRIFQNFPDNQHLVRNEHYTAIASQFSMYSKFNKLNNSKFFA